MQKYFSFSLLLAYYVALSCFISVDGGHYRETKHIWNLRPHSPSKLRQNRALVVNCSKNGFIAHPEDPTKYIQCVLLGAQWYYYIFSCPVTSYFDSGLGKCVIGSIPTVTTPTTNAPTTTANMATTPSTMATTTADTAATTANTAATTATTAANTATTAANTATTAANTATTAANTATTAANTATTAATTT